MFRRVCRRPPRPARPPFPPLRERRPRSPAAPIRRHHPYLSGKAPTLADENDVARHEFRDREYPFHTAPDHDGGRLGQIAQGFQRAFAEGFLEHHEPHRGDGGHSQKQSLGQISQQEIEAGRRDEQKEHGFAQRAADDAPDTPAANGVQGVRTELQKASLRLSIVEAGPAGCHFIEVRDAAGKSTPPLVRPGLGTEP